VQEHCTHTTNTTPEITQSERNSVI